MNLIEISEQLKDVPDQLLMKEVEAPSGAYPAYLVVTEMSRRKRMRDQAMKEAPTTTVAQDLAQPSREQMMAAMAAVQRRMGQQTPPPPQLVSSQPPQAPQAQMMSQPAPRLNAGIMAAPQAANALSAQDVMAAEEPRRMAGGGMVAFAKGGDIHYDDRGTVPRFNGQSGSFLFPEDSLLGRIQRGSFFREAVPNSWLGQFQQSYANDPAILREQEDRRRREEEARQREADAAELRRIQNRAANTQAAPVVAQTPPPASSANNGAPVTRSGTGSTTNTSAGRTALPTVNLGPVPTLNLTPVTIPLEAEAKDLSARFGAMREPTDEERAEARKRGAERYAREMPFRYGFLEEDIAKREKDIKGRRASNINEALIQSGLGIMRSKSPYFMQAVGEGGTEGLSAYRQGLKDIREGEKDILQSKVSFANAQSLYDQNKFAAAEKEKDDGEKKYERGLTRLNTENAILVRNQNTLMQAQQLRQQGEVAQHTAGLNALKTQMEMQELPYKLDLYKAQAGYYNRGPVAHGGRADTTPNPAQIAAARKIAQDSLNAEITAKQSSIKFLTPDYNKEVERRTAEVLKNNGMVYTPISPAQGAPNTGTSGTAPGWSVQQVR